MSLPEPVEAYEPGLRFHAEIREQPQALRRLLEHDAEFARVADAIKDWLGVRNSINCYYTGSATPATRRLADLLADFCNTRCGAIRSPRACAEPPRDHEAALEDVVPALAVR